MSGTDARALLPAESMALTVGLAQVLRGEQPSENVAVACVLALARFADRYDYTALPADVVTCIECGAQQTHRVCRACWNRICDEPVTP